MEVDVRGWMTEKERLLLRRLAFQKDVLELGAYEGLSTVNLAATAQSVTTVDTFDGRATPEPKDTLALLLANLGAFGVLPKVKVRKGLTQEVLPTLQEQFDLIFIDADHSYEGVKKDVANSLPLLKEGGVLAFHDYNREHGGVVHNVNPLRDAGWRQLEQVDSLIALTQAPLPTKEPVIYLVMPHRDGWVHLGASQGLDFASVGGPKGGSKYKMVVDNYGTSVLTQCFNHLFAAALSARETDGVTHFAMLHNDVVVPRGWLDLLMAEMEAGPYDCVSAVVRLKNKTGNTSTGIDTPGNPWSVRRLTMKELCKLPETFTAQDVPFRSEEAQLLLNTGCWLMKLDQPWVSGLCFRQQDKIIYSTPLKRFMGLSISEDWDFSRQLHSRGARLAATRKVSTVHQFPEFHTKGPMGEWAVDEDYLVDHPECKEQKEQPDGEPDGTPDRGGDSPDPSGDGRHDGELQRGGAGAHEEAGAFGDAGLCPVRAG